VPSSRFRRLLYGLFEKKCNIVTRSVSEGECAAPAKHNPSLTLRVTMNCVRVELFVGWVISRKMAGECGDSPAHSLLPVPLLCSGVPKEIMPGPDYLSGGHQGPASRGMPLLDKRKTLGPTEHRRRDSTNNIEHDSYPWRRFRQPVWLRASGTVFPQTVRLSRPCPLDFGVDSG